LSAFLEREKKEAEDFVLLGYTFFDKDRRSILEIAEAKQKHVAVLERIVSSLKENCGDCDKRRFMEIA